MFEFTVPLSKEFILKRVSEEDIFERYLGIRPEYVHQFCNPLRTDNHPGCGFYVDKFQRIKFSDQAGGFNWDCFNVVEYLFKCDFKTAMKTIATDFGLTGGTLSNPTINRVQRGAEKLELRIKRRDWNWEDKTFWFDRYYQTRDDLAWGWTSPVSHAWYYRSSGIHDLFYSYKTGDPCYAYHFGNYNYKLYFPFREKHKKFRQNRGDIIQGYAQLPASGEILVITKSMKDVLCLRKLGITAIAPMSESQVISLEVMTELKTRFKLIFTLFDFDRAGIRLTRKYEKAYNTTSLLFGKAYRHGTFVQGSGGIKDFADYLELYRLEPTKQLVSDIYNLMI